MRKNYRGPEERQSIDRYYAIAKIKNVYFT